MKKSMVVKKDNALVNAAYTLTLSEQRLILLAVAQGAGEPDTLREMSVHALDYAERFNLTPRAAYDALSEATRQLFERKFSYVQITEKGNTMHVVSRWVSRVAYTPGEGTVSLSFAPDVLPVLCGLQRRFTWYGLEHIASLTSAHSVRLYELLIAWRSTGQTPMIELADFRRRMGIEEGEYSRMSDFKRWVLDAAIKQINAHSDIKANYEQYKRGRSISGFSFSFKVKAPAIVGSTEGNEEKPVRKVITKAQAESMARPGELWPELYSRLGRDYIIK